MKKKKRRSGIRIMAKLIGLIRPLAPVMTGAVILGTLGYLCAIFLTILAGGAIVKGISGTAGTFDFLPGIRVGSLLALLPVIAVLRGVLHYAEQYCNHFIAFKLLAIIRHKVFAALRKLCPAKLEGKDKGNLISVLTTDIELLEVFYAHTISPIAIAVLTSLILVFFMGSYSVYAGLWGLAAYLIAGAAIPLWNGRRGGGKGMEFREGFGELNSFVLDSLWGLDETIQFGGGKERKEQMTKRSEELSSLQKDLNHMEGAQRSLTGLVIFFFSFGMLFLTLFLYQRGQIGFDGILICTFAMMGSFGPTAALSNLSNNLSQTLASAERVLSVLEEEPAVREIPDGEPAGGEHETAFGGTAAEHVTFGYDRDLILEDCSLQIQAEKIVGICGPSGSGKSTLLKLLMRFWDVQGGRITVSGEDVRKIPTARLRNTESYVTQETVLFHDSIANNIAVGRPGASLEEIRNAAKKASVHDFIMTLPRGYDTEVGELGDTLSGGEKQRIGIARAFLHDAPFILLDEPTSNLDSLNEGIILKSLREEGEKRTVLLVSHRKSTMNIADTVFKMEEETKAKRTTQFDC